MAGKPRYTQKQIEAALVAVMGNVSAAARSLGMQRHHLHSIIRKSERLQQVVLDARQSMCDNAESALNRAVINGEAWAVCFTLKTQAKDRGYVERVQQEVSGRDGQALEINATVKTVFDYSAAIADIAGGSEAHPASPGANEIRRDGEALG